jgi:hypothetical protein
MIEVIERIKTMNNRERDKLAAMIEVSPATLRALVKDESRTKASLPTVKGLLGYYLQQGDESMVYPLAQEATGLDLSGIALAQLQECLPDA